MAPLGALARRSWEPWGPSKRISYSIDQIRGGGVNSLCPCSPSRSPLGLLGALRLLGPSWGLE
eukprot:5381302-Pyramimonas_sp.AAC.1